MMYAAAHKYQLTTESEIQRMNSEILMRDKKYEGMLPEKNGHTPAHHPLKVRFVPTAVGRYRCTFNFKVKNGETAKLEVSAESSYREEDISVVHPDKHLRVMLDGEKS